MYTKLNDADISLLCEKGITNATAWLVYARIKSMNPCCMSNETLAKMFHMSKGSVSNIISELKKQNLISVNMIKLYDENGNVMTHREIFAIHKKRKEK